MFTSSLWEFTDIGGRRILVNPLMIGAIVERADAGLYDVYVGNRWATIKTTQTIQELEKEWNERIEQRERR